VLTKPVMQTKATVTGALTLELCAGACYALNKNFKTAGAENGAYCFCDTSPRGNKISDNQCNMPCTGNSAQMCGGSVKLSEVWLSY
jgi:hypothetical protein